MGPHWEKNCLIPLSWVLNPRFPTKMVVDSLSPPALPPNDLYYSPPLLPPPEEKLTLISLPSRKLPFSASLAFWASEGLAKATKALPLLLPYWSVNILMLVIVPYFENCVLIVDSSVLKVKLPTKSSEGPDSFSSSSSSSSSFLVFFVVYLLALLFDFWETLDCFRTAFLGSSSSLSSSDSLSESLSLFAWTFFAAGFPFAAITLTSSSDDSSSLLSALTFLLGATFFWMDSFLTGLMSSSEDSSLSIFLVVAAFFGG